MSYHFSACRVSSKDNTIFPDQIIIDDDVVKYRKSRLIGYKTTKIGIDDIASVSVNVGILFADVIIETKGGRKIRAHGFTRSDAEEIADLLS